MKRNIKRIGCLLMIIILSSVVMFNNAYAQEPVQFLDWGIKANKNAFHPGEPVLLTLNIRNMGTHEEKVNFGMDGIEAFSMEIHDSNDIIVAKGGKIQRFGISRPGVLLVTPGKTEKKSIILNQWCSTLLSPGQYRVICNIEYRLRSESKRIEGSDGFRAGLLHRTQLELDIQIIKMDRAKFKEMLETLDVALEVEPKGKNTGEWVAERDFAREMLAFTESELAVSYQLQLLRVEQYGWRQRDEINSLVKSGTLEAAKGLIQIIEDNSTYILKPGKDTCIDGVYRLRETGKAEIIDATENFVAKYKRPVLLKSMD